ncbi:DUF2726 domain-containing protein [Stutzerimonas kirkiae]|uniref:DUF2726 domain-containing protein n=1 Tax=Stutzerimonas kirkiae TaxID=2211392 RepID=A0A4Q9R884_9GAMM|nr:DUF2726 domain-containing protein [Stutzerimonas kirkiae]TBU96839.1 hypothetical protein DNJ96_09760 [Stutzerimonas kirkiae]TBV00564.1 hypothetical protein DNJ95_14710 [Stutzerimonas kirkiae]TBV08426.1 hypothetical protein DNK08_10970 [Stutzerimonas kirkiae]TBV16702.1 hypothetical protein DNK01_02280 [Stutzerimonas kirkiae]
MDFFFLIFAIMVAIGVAMATGKKKTPRNYNKRRFPTWPTSESRTTTASSTPKSFASQQSKTPTNGFRYDPDGEWPFQKRQLITDTESLLFQRLREAFPEHYIFTQVQLSQLVSVKKGHDFKRWFLRINQMSVDFVIADQQLNTIAAIELDDKTHYTNEERHKADAKKDKTLTAAGIRIVRWRCEIMPSTEQIRLAFPEIVSRESITAFTSEKTANDRTEPSISHITPEQDRAPAQLKNF